MTISIKALSVGIGLGALGAGSSLIYWYSIPNSLRAELVNSGKTPLSIIKGKDSLKWKELAKKYAKLKSIDLLNPTITIESDKDPKDIDLENLKKACEELFNKKKGEKDFNESLKKATDWCISGAEKQVTETIVGSTNINRGNSS